jgi:hypothetical protein
MKKTREHQRRFAELGGDVEAAGAEVLARRDDGTTPLAFFWHDTGMLSIAAGQLSDREITVASAVLSALQSATNQLIEFD